MPASPPLPHHTPRRRRPRCHSRPNTIPAPTRRRRRSRVAVEGRRPARLSRGGCGVIDESGECPGGQSTSSWQSSRRSVFSAASASRTRSDVTVTSLRCLLARVPPTQGPGDSRTPSRRGPVVPKLPTPAPRSPQNEHLARTPNRVPHRTLAATAHSARRHTASVASDHGSGRAHGLMGVIPGVFPGVIAGVVPGCPKPATGRMPSPMTQNTSIDSASHPARCTRATPIHRRRGSRCATPF